MNDVTQDVVIFDSKLIEEREYWVNRLSNGTGPSNVPHHSERPAAPPENDVMKIALAGDAYERLMRVTAESPFLIYAMILAAVKVCLYKYNGSKTISVGSPVLTKEAGSAKANALVILDEMDSAMPFRQLLMNVRETLLEAYKRQRYPFERLVRDLGLTGLENRCPLFDVALMLADIHGSMPEVNNDITIKLALARGHISGEVSFNRALFTGEAIERFGGHINQVLNESLKRIELPIGDLEIITEAEREQILWQWNAAADAQGDDDDECRLHELIEQQADGRPDAIALAADDLQVSFSELERRANRLGHYLRRQGVGPEAVVGVSLRRGVELVVALLGVLKAGGAYLPLEASQPLKRRRQMLVKAGARLVISDGSVGEADCGIEGVRVIELEAEREAIARESAMRVGVRAAAEGLIYVLYTSGSSGEAKGVMVTQGGVSNYVRWAREAYQGEWGRGTAVHTPVGFDLTVTSLWVVLAVGERVRLVSEEEGVEGLSRWVREEGGYRLLKVTPAHVGMLEGLMSEAEVRRAAGVVVVGGEELRQEQVRRWVKAGGGVRVVNEYGPTETVVGCSVYEVREEGERGGVAIGRGIGQVRVMVEEGAGRLAGVGVKGELVVSGAGVARGYIGEAGQTGERFVPEGHSGARGARQYRTGDEGRWRGGGELEYEGRMDGQVKVRGYRIELGEVEEAMRRCRGVKEAVASVRGEGEARRLVGYYVKEAGVEVEWRRLREELREELPGYMVPEAVVEIAEVLLTSNGKVDRRALPEVEEEMQEREEEREKTGMEEEVARIWGEVLGKERVGLADNFFDLGGNSLLMAQVYSKVRKRIRPELSIIQLFKYPTVETLAGFLVGGDEDSASSRNEAAMLERITEGKERMRALINHRQRADV